MAADFLLLQRYPREMCARFRHYEWRGPAWTFGFSQQWDWVRTQLPADARDVCRRVTGGGIVDHCEDWTYALVVPRGHALYEARAVESYREVHEVLCRALEAQGVRAEVKRSCEPAKDGDSCAPAGVCFQRGELFDVIAVETEKKIAGAAQKRAKHGMLMQGSIWRSACGTVIDWERFEETFAAGLANLLGGEVAHPGWPEWDCEEAVALAESYATPEWNERR